MTTPPDRPDQQQPSGPVNPNNPTQAFGAPGQVPTGPPSQGFPAQGPAHPGPPGYGHPQGAAPDVRRQGPPNQGPPNQGPPNQGPPNQGPPNQGAPNQGRPGDGPSGPWTQGGPRSPGLPPQPMGPRGPQQGPFGTPSHVGAPRPQSANAIWTLGLISLIAVVCGLSISEDGKNAWDTVHAWGALAILGSLLTLATVVAAGNLGATRAWQVAACGAGALVLFWVLFVLPGVGSNTSLVTTIGVAAGAVAVWIAPGRADATGRPGGGPSEHTW